jgi:hypothetical protein
MYSIDKQRISSFSALLLVRNDEEQRKKITSVYLREIIIAIGTVKTVFTFRVGRCSPMRGSTVAEK